ncbi:DNA-directed DNA polymerase II small subunit [Candidatus Woesearchaeota archaeon]|nr:DNA-directed DNA polymerase II small subunit [Candidatus Woesearchaeota archaeon]
MEQSKQARIEELFEKGILVSEDALDRPISSTLLHRIESEPDLIVLNTDYAQVIEQQSSLVDWYEVDRYRVDAEKDRDDELYQSQLQTFRSASLSSFPHSTGMGSSSPLFDSSTHLLEDITSLEVPLTPVGLAQGESISASSASSSPIAEYGSSTQIQPDLLPDEEFEQDSTLPIIETPLSVVTIVTSFQNIPKKHTTQDFTNFFLSRYRFLEGLLRQRQELSHPVSIGRALAKKDKEEITIIGLVENISETKNGNLVVTIEDPTGRIKAIVSKSKKEIHANALDLVVDEVVGITGTYMDKVIFVENITWPDIPQTHELKKGPVEEYAIFLSDVHVGSKLFLQDEFEKFLRWLSGQTGNEQQRQIAAAVKYIFIAGDLVDGIGIYPAQEEELSIKTITGQYAAFTELLKKIPSSKQIIMCPGNHDAVHLAEPQPAFYQTFSKDLFGLPNVSLVTNPSVVNIGKSANFEGFDVLLYHGYSFDYYVANVPSIRNGGGYHRSDLIMKFLLKRRHLAPSFKSTPYYPAYDEDPLIVKKVPDFLITGHIHYCSVANYKGVTMISGSCWQAKTTFQEKLGHEPEPGRVPLVNLKTREVKVLRFA